MHDEVKGMENEADMAYLKTVLKFHPDAAVEGSSVCRSLVCRAVNASSVS
jgi:hypothetical protein